MNAIYKLIWNVSTGTWAVAHELAAARGKRTGRNRLASALAVALTLPAGAALAADDPEALTCAINESVSADGLRCEAGTTMSPMGGVGTMATAAELQDFIKFSNAAGATAAVAAGSNGIAMGNGARVDSLAAGSTGGIAIGGNAFAENGSLGGALAFGSVALGGNATAYRGASVAIGSGARASVDPATGAAGGANGGVSIGRDSLSGNAAVAIGWLTSSAAGSGTALGIRANVDRDAESGVAVGSNAVVRGYRSADDAVVNSAQNSAALGAGAQVAASATGTATSSLAMGNNARVTAGTGTAASANGSVAIGSDARVTAGAAAADNSLALGSGTRVTASSAVALGAGSTADTANTVSVGNTTTQRKIVNMAAGTADTDAVNLGQVNTALSTKVNDTLIKVGGTTAATVSGHSTNIAIGQAASATALGSGFSSMAVGRDSAASGSGAVALGNGAKAANAFAVALGSGSETSADYTVSVGSATTQRKIVNMAAGTADTDAANLAQLRGVAAGLGGGATVAADGSVTAPSYTVGGTTVNNVGTALTNLDGRVTSNTTSLGDITTRVTSLEGVGPGVVQYDSANQVLNVGKDIAGNSVNFASDSQGARTLTGVRSGAVNATSTEAVNGAQLFVTNSRVTAAEGDITTLGNRVTTNEGDIVTLGGRVTTSETNISNLDGRVTVNEGSITTINGRLDGLADGSAGIVTYDGTAGAVNVASGQAGTRVNFANNAGDARTLAGVAEGTLAAGSAEAVNGAQLFATNERVSTAEGNIVNVQGDVTTLGNRVTTSETNISNLDGRVTVNEGSITTINGRLDGLADGSAGIVTYDGTAGAVNVASGQAGTRVNFANNAGDARTLAGVAEGTLAAGSTEAVNGAQLFATNERVSTAEGNIVNVQGDVTTLGNRVTTSETNISNLDGRVTVNEGNITNLTQQIGDLSSGGAGIVTYDATAGAVNVATAQGGSVVNLAGTDGVRTLAGVKDGTIAAGSTEAVTGSQLNDTNERVTTSETNISNLDGRVTTSETNISNLDGRVTVNEGSITNLTQQIGDLSSGGAGIVTYDATAGAVNVATAQGGSVVNLAGTDGVRTLAGVKDGTIAAGSAEAVTGSQLNDTNERVTTTEGNITTIQTNVTNLGNRVTTAEGDITNLNTAVSNLSSGAAGIVSYDATSGTVNVAALQGGQQVNMAGTDGNRVLAGVADGKVEAASDEAVNGSQLNDTNERVGAAETNISNLDTRVTNNEGDITNLTTQVTNLSSGAIGLVTVDAATGDVKVASDKGGDRVDIEGTDGKRRLGGVANGLDDGDAVTMAQLRAAGAIDPVSGDVLSVLTYDDSSLAKASLGGTNGTVLANVASGLIAAGSREAVNGGQLYQMNADWEAKWSSMDGRVGAIEDGIADGSIGGPGNGGQNPGPSPGTGEGSVAIGDGSDASGSGAVAIGDGSAASGSGSVAIGEGAEASNNGSVAIGSGSKTDRDNEFSVGSPGNERVISNVAAGTRPTDAVNLQQMNDRFDAEREYTDGRFNQLDKRLDRMGAISAAYAGMAINTAGLSGDNRVGAGIGSQNGRSALAVGYQRILGEKKNVSVSLGGAFSGSDQSVSAGAGFSW